MTHQDFLQAAARNNPCLPRDPSRGTNPQSARGAAVCCQSPRWAVALLQLSRHQSCPRALQLNPPCTDFSAGSVRMSRVCQSPFPPAWAGSTLSSFRSSSRAAAAAPLGQSRSSGSLVCQQADKRQSPLHLPVALADAGSGRTRWHLLSF